MARFSAQTARITNNRSFFKDERGLSSVEYLILLVLIAGVTLPIWKALGGDITERLQGSETTLKTDDTVPTPTPAPTSRRERGESRSRP